MAINNKAHAREDYKIMGRSYLDSEELTLANMWLKTIFFPIAVTNTLNPYYISHMSNSKSSVVSACNEIYSFIKHLRWDTNNDLAIYIDQLSKNNTLYKVDPNGSDSAYSTSNPNVYGLTKNQVCRFIANLCAKCKIFWDDTQHTPEELRYFIATDIGKALWDFRCFVSQTPDTVKIKGVAQSNTTQSQAQANNAAATTQKTAGSSGSKLNINNAGGLINATKEVLYVSDMYWIDGTFAAAGKATKPRLHVSPYGQSGPLQVKYSTGQGFDDCILFFDNYNAANDFLAKADAAKPSTVASLSIKRQKTDPNGYFKVTTNLGDAYIKASKLHEMLEKLYEAKEETEYGEADYFEKTKAACEALEKYMR